MSDYIPTEHHGDVVLCESGGAVGVESNDAQITINVYKLASQDDDGWISFSLESEWAVATPAEVRAVARMLLKRAGGQS